MVGGGWCVERAWAAACRAAASHPFPSRLVSADVPLPPGVDPPTDEPDELAADGGPDEGDRWGELALADLT